MKSHSFARFYAAISVIIIWFAVGLQFRLSLALNEGDVIATIKIFLSYFTVLTNILCAVCLTVILLFKKSAIGRFFSKPSTLTAITIYILVVGIIYNISLRGLADLSGLHAVANEFLHLINPLLFFGFWLLFVDKSTLNYKQAFIWLIYPLFYVVITVIRGEMINEYPYPFINVVKLGYPKAILNTVIIMLVFWLLSLIFIFVSKRLQIKN